MAKNKVGIVILNYLNFQDTIECIRSALKISYSPIEIIVVDNGSPNGSLGKISAQFKKNPTVTIISSDKNLGFAQGNNLGINYARTKLKCDFVFAVNNDTLFTDKNIIKSLISRHTKNGNIGLIGPKIIGKDGLNQNPQKTGLTYKKIIRDLFFSFLFSVFDIDFLRKLPVIREFLRFKNRNSSGKCINDRAESIILHGSAVMFTPTFFKKYSGFYPGTFLYYEENILAIILDKLKLVSYYDDKCEILHKEDMSSTLSFGNKNRLKSRMQNRSIRQCLKIKLFGIPLEWKNK